VRYLCYSQKAKLGRINPSIALDTAELEATSSWFVLWACAHTCSSNFLCVIRQKPAPSVKVCRLQIPVSVLTDACHL